MAKVWRVIEAMIVSALVAGAVVYLLEHRPVPHSGVVVVPIPM